MTNKLLTEVGINYSKRFKATLVIVSSSWTTILRMRSLFMVTELLMALSINSSFMAYVLQQSRIFFFLRRNWPFHLTKKVLKSNCVSNHKYLSGNILKEKQSRLIQHKQDYLFTKALMEISAGTIATTMTILQLIFRNHTTLSLPVSILCQQVLCQCINRSLGWMKCEWISG